MVDGHRISKKVNTEKFLEQIRHYSKNQIECTNHTFFRLNEKQRKIFKCEKIKDYLLDEIPLYVGLQNNNNYAIFYKYPSNKIMRVIIEVTLTKIWVVTFYFIDKAQLPRIK